MIQLGYDLITEQPITAEILETGHVCIVGGSGSGKSLATIYILYNLLKNNGIIEKNNVEKRNVELSLGDFKQSGDYAGITGKFAEFEKVTELIEDFYAEFEKTPENNPTIKILLIDEYAGYIIWLTQNDKQMAEMIKRKISNILMLGRSRHCFVWCIQQRISAGLFPAGVGAVDNFQICIGLGRLTVDSRKSLFAGEHLEDTEFEEQYHPKTGQGLILIDGQELKPIQIPYISDKEKLKALLVKLANECPRD